MIGGYDRGCDLPELIGHCLRSGSGERRSHGEGERSVDMMERLLVADIQGIRCCRVRRIRERRILEVRKWIIGNREITVTSWSGRVTRLAGFGDK
jgi:hypothetical protein